MRKLVILGLSALLSACGGGGGGGSSGPVASTNTFNIQSGWVALVSTGWSKTFNITGSCSGTISMTRGAANTATTFESAGAISGTSVISTSFSNCTPASSSATETLYYDSNYIPKGFSVQGGNYGVYASAPVLPSAAKVGDVAIVGTINIYTSSAKATSAGHQDLSYVIEADTSTTAIANLVSKVYNSSGILTSTEQDRYRVAANGSLTPLSLDVQYANGSTIHLIGN
jgi:hypothetical protein